MCKTINYRGKTQPYTLAAGTFGRVVAIAGGFIPLDLCRLGAGRDAGLRDIVVPCLDCKTEFRLGDGDSAEYCQDCYDKAGDENAVSDGNMSEEEFAAKWGG